MIQAAGVEVAPEDLVYPAPGEKLSSGDTVTVRTAKPVAVVIDGVAQEITSTAGTVGELLAPEGETVTVGAPIITIAGGEGQPDADIGRSEHGEKPSEEPGGSVLVGYGTDEQKKLAHHIVEKGWHCTMVLTEPDAGSDVGAGRTKAVQQPDGTWHITGVKRFITSGESDMTDNVVHFVLARPEGAGPGTKGLSLFIVPKFHVDPETGEVINPDG